MSLPMRFCRDNLRNRMGQRRCWVDVKDGVRVLALDQPPGRQNHGDEMCASILE